MKNLTAALAAATVSLSLAACGGTSSAGGSASSADAASSPAAASGSLSKADACQEFLKYRPDTSAAPADMYKAGADKAADLASKVDDAALKAALQALADNGHQQASNLAAGKKSTVADLKKGTALNTAVMKICTGA